MGISREWFRVEGGIPELGELYDCYSYCYYYYYKYYNYCCYYFDYEYYYYSFRVIGIRKRVEDFGAWRLEDQPWSLWG